MNFTRQEPVRVSGRTPAISPITLTNSIPVGMTILALFWRADSVAWSLRKIQTIFHPVRQVFLFYQSGRRGEFPDRFTSLCRVEMHRGHHLPPELLVLDFISSEIKLSVCRSRPNHEHQQN